MSLEPAMLRLLFVQDPASETTYAMGPQVFSEHVHTFNRPRSKVDKVFHVQAYVFPGVPAYV